MASIKYKDNGTYKDIVVKVGDTLPIGAEVDYDGSVVPDGWEQVSDPNEYSTTEQVIGKWITGKPIYRKVIDYFPTEIIGAGGTTTNVQVPHNISNFSQIINCRVITQTNHVFPTLASSTGSTLTSGNAIIQVNSTNIILRIINDSWSSRHFYFILEYTKSTD